MPYYSKSWTRSLQETVAQWENTNKRAEIFLRTRVKPIPHIGNTNFGFTQSMF